MIHNAADFMVYLMALLCATCICGWVLIYIVDRIITHTKLWANYIKYLWVRKEFNAWRKGKEAGKEAGR